MCAASLVGGEMRMALCLSILSEEQRNKYVHCRHVDRMVMVVMNVSQRYI